MTISLHLHMHAQDQTKCQNQPSIRQNKMNRLQVDKMLMWYILLPSNLSLSPSLSLSPHHDSCISLSLNHDLTSLKIIGFQVVYSIRQLQVLGIEDNTDYKQDYLLTLQYDRIMKLLCVSFIMYHANFFLAFFCPGFFLSTIRGSRTSSFSEERIVCWKKEIFEMMQ